ncbi:MAG: hypothetical protein HRU30_21545 [Rhodobacteraceae bacterium]|nr:hypothetical protein [Paracoccaceae bacterium]
MAAGQDVTIYLEDPLLRSAKDGAHNFIGLMSDVLTERGYRVSYAPDHARADHPAGKAITHMAPPPPGGLVFRRVYAYPFWAIEASAERWHWDVAKRAFDPAQVDPKEARQFTQRWRKRLFPDVTSSRTGYFYAPLQGRIREHRSFQQCAPVDMVARVAYQVPDVEIRLGLHPRETYDDADHSAVQRLVDAHPNIRLTSDPMEQTLAGCDGVITQNSSVAFFGYLLNKPAMLFAKIDFHHIALGADTDVSTLAHHAPDFDRYVYWFWQKNSINAGRDTAKHQIAQRFQDHGW